ncbi:MAG: methyltransferase domain-containing protein [Alphaproteobacteria bacterium]|jgi:ubiquinone/menaquinone biosynthesis C-methylase UbiE|nr:methyltransferase domain-containing protein [Alphaproteobacteria bacterium]MBP9776907.1 methyltransferase domain-containing protein [Alphaproteobacteria bacterium]MDP3444392.1 methyltransferase domain-containing protein [Ignavibacteria bacterium]
MIYRALLLSFLFASQAVAMENNFEEASFYSRMTRKAQNFCYQVMAKTFWDPLMEGFKPARTRAMELLELEPHDRIFLIGEGSGLDFEVLPEEIAKQQIWALDYSSEMVKQAKRKAQLLGIPEDQCMLGDAQALPFNEEKFDKIFFPLSLGSIPNPSLALKEAERVLSPKGKIVVLEKLVDDRESISYARKLLNFFTKFIFADINRNLTQIIEPVDSLQIIHYESTQGQLTGLLGRMASPYYRLATLVRKADYPDIEACEARIENRKDK